MNTEATIIVSTLVPVIIALVSLVSWMVKDNAKHKKGNSTIYKRINDMEKDVAVLKSQHQDYVKKIVVLDKKVDALNAMSIETNTLIKVFLEENKKNNKE